MKCAAIPVTTESKRHKSFLHDMCINGPQNNVLLYLTKMSYI